MDTIKLKTSSSMTLPEDTHMVTQFTQWFLDIQDNAIQEKKAKAKAKGDESQWQKEIWKSPEKNAAIKHRFRDEGERLGFKSRPSYKTNAGEWLYDFVWREFDDNNHLKRVALAMEIEVSDQSFVYDFNKLLQAESRYKIMVFQVKTEAEVEATFRVLQKAAAIYETRVPSHYLLVGWCTSNNCFSFLDFKKNCSE
ncbi:hypothetical protein AB4138_07435 [Vibrio sp. 10N.286.52.C3]|uniref:hypothetical protein n=1 Tax=unclassified Vibrio TaxID=2614977 RepID=UPI00354F55FA